MMETVRNERLGIHVNQESLYQALQELQVPCPWGNLVKGEGIKKNVEGIPELDTIPRIPLALVVGSGYTPMKEAYKSVARVDNFGRIIMSDIIHPNTMPEGYVYLDLEDSENVNLFGYKVHAIMSIGVFTYDTHGVHFQSRDVERKTAKALSDLLMPGGIIANDNLVQYNRRFEHILMNQFGFKEVKDDYSSVILQKP
ncbi:MAG: hypothetical protein ABIG69_04440 [Bacteroidota bacterium]